ncbi:TerC family protein [Lacrimispora sp.]|uniref:TerC family protein n=1 Tax=Lacrimispora sp. TaxID=2719234 RepID=UPI0028A16925|nr:hypothetical protein [Lacrimispora sp.]
MALLLQVIFLNFMIACENIGVLALATNGMSPNKATKARRIGISTSLAFKLILIAVAGFLFVMPWLHIRIVGGILLLYTTFNILLQHSQESGGKTKSKSGEKTYISTLLSSAKGMIVFILLTLFINTIGLSFSFNVGTIRPLQYLALFLIQVLLLLSYTAAFNLMYVFIKRKALLIISCLLYTMLESGIAAAVASNDRFLIIAYFFPSYHFAALLGLSANTYSISTAILIPVLYIGLFTYIGYCGDQSRNRMSVSAKY